MNEPDYLNLLEDNLADIVARRAPFVVPSVANDIPLDQAVAEMHHISAELARSLCECIEQGATPCGACDTAPRRRA